MKRRTSWLWVLGLVFSITLGVVAWTTSVQARTKPVVSQAWMQPPVVQAQLPDASTPVSEPKAPPGPEARGARGADASLCFTCGGAYPTFAGSFLTTVNAGRQFPKERGSQCEGDVRFINDDNPQLCTN